MTSIQFVVHPLPGTQEQLAEKLKSVADRLNRYGLQGSYWLILKKGVKSKCFISRFLSSLQYQGGGEADSCGAFSLCPPV